MQWGRALDFVDQVLKDGFQFAFFGACILIFALLRPAMVRDYDGRRLPANLQSTSIIAIMYLSTYAILVLVLIFFANVINDVPRMIPQAGGLLRSLQTIHLAAPFYAIATLGALWQIPFFSEIDRAFLISLHNSRNFRDNTLLLTHHLAHCEFHPSTVERSHYEDELNQLGVYFRDNEGKQIERVIVHNWRKVSTLIRMVQSWNEDASRVLSSDDMKQFVELEMSHRRKTMLALEIIRFTQQIGKDTDPTAMLSNLRELLAAGSSVQMPESVEAYLREKLGQSSEQKLQSPIELSAEQFNNYVHQIEKYFEAEYRTLLQQIALLTARSVVLARSVREARLDQLKAAGFVGIGHLSHVSVERLISSFFAAMFGGLLIIYFGLSGALPARNLPGCEREAELWIVSGFAVTLAIAGLIGAIVGSSRANARSTEPRWEIYLGAGLLAAASQISFTVLIKPVLMKLMYEMHVMSCGDIPPSPIGWSIAFSLQHLAICISIAYLARQKSWHLLPAGLSQFDRYLMRAVDGALVCVAVLVGYAGTLALLDLIELDPPKLVTQMPVQGAVLVGLFAFLIGALFLRDARLSAHATIVDADSPAMSPQAAIA